MNKGDVVEELVNALDIAIMDWHYDICRINFDVEAYAQDSTELRDILYAALTPLVAQNTDNPPTGFNWDKFDMDKFFKEADEVGRIRAGVAQKDHCPECWKRIAQSGDIPIYGCVNAACRNCHAYPTSENPTPTVKEESHTQGWEEGLRQYLSQLPFRDPDVIEKLATDLVRRTKEIASQEYERGLKANPAVEHCAEPACPECNKAAFEAGYAQCKVDAVAVIENIAPKTVIGNRLRGKCPECKNPDVVCKDKDILVKDTWIYEQIITALSSLTHNK